MSFQKAPILGVIDHREIGICIKTDPHEVLDEDGYSWLLGPYVPVDLFVKEEKWEQ